MKWTTLAVAAAMTLPAGVALAEWKPSERVETYAISGASPIELYRSIGERGPKAGAGRAIAFTDFKLTWTRNYVPQPDGACTLVSAVPKLTIIYRLPKPSGKLSADLQRRWNVFIDGVQRHEKVHGQMILDLVRKIEATSVGFSVGNDPKCSEIRRQLTEKLAALSQEQRQRSRDFDRVELTDGGNVHQLILAFVNEP